MYEIQNNKREYTVLKILSPRNSPLKLLFLLHLFVSYISIVGQSTIVSTQEK